jgi:hypothetical protein
VGLLPQFDLIFYFPCHSHLFLFIVNPHIHIHRDTGVQIDQLHQQVSFPDLDDGVHVIQAQFFDRQNRPRGDAATRTIMSRRYLEHMEHTDYPVVSEAPRNDGSTAAMPGVEEWDLGGRGWDGWPQETSDEVFLRKRWTRNGHGGGRDDGDVWDASKIFKVYAEFHDQVAICVSVLC